jgi:hypothetical protein
MTVKLGDKIALTQEQATLMKSVYNKYANGPLVSNVTELKYVKIGFARTCLKKVITKKMLNDEGIKLAKSILTKIK